MAITLNSNVQITAGMYSGYKGIVELINRDKIHTLYGVRLNPFTVAYASLDDLIELDDDFRPLEEEA